MLDRVLSRWPPRDGLVLEVGVWGGNSIKLMSKFVPNNTIYGFDNFRGPKADWVRDCIAFVFLLCFGWGALLAFPQSTGILHEMQLFMHFYFRLYFYGCLLHVR